MQAGQRQSRHTCPETGPGTRHSSLCRLCDWLQTPPEMSGMTQDVWKAVKGHISFFNLFILETDHIKSVLPLSPVYPRDSYKDHTHRKLKYELHAYTYSASFIL